MSRQLADEIMALNCKQRESVLDPASSVLRAGPGSGKTRTLVAKIAFLLQGRLPQARGITSVTYTNQASLEARRRLQRLGVDPTDNQLVSGTLHAWCMSNVLRPFAHLVNPADRVNDSTSVASKDQILDLLEQSLIERNARFGQVQYETLTMTKIRRALASGESVDSYENEKVEAAELYETRLASCNLIDYEAMVGRALGVLRQSALARELLVARRPWLVVDEYQDLGPVLHQIVVLLVEEAGMKVFAVGDPDQSILGFTGADPRFLNELADRDDFKSRDLELNYRFGSALIAASHAVLGQTRNHVPAPSREDAGTIDLVEVDGDLDSHGTVVAERARLLKGRGVDLERIAVLYPFRGPLLDSILAALNSAGWPFVHERDDRLPDSAMKDFVTAAATRTLAGPLPCGWPNLPKSDTVSVLTELASRYRRLRARSGLSQVSFADACRMMVRLTGDAAVAGSNSAAPWVSVAFDELDLEEIAEHSPDRSDLLFLKALVDSSEEEALLLEEITTTATPGKIVVTTYHSSKGREFDHVLIPGLVEGQVPKWNWNGAARRWEPPAGGALSEARRNFYVALTRSKSSVTLIYGSGYSHKGYWNNNGRCRFVDDVAHSLSS